MNNISMIDDAVRGFVIRYRIGVFMLGMVRGFWLLTALLLGMIVLDTALGLPIIVRLLMDLALVAAVVGVGVMTVRSGMAARSQERMVLRMVEQEHPEMDNTLINAVDFQERLAQNKTLGFSHALMAREIDNAEYGIGELHDQETCLRPPNLKPETRALALLLLVFTLLACVQFRLLATVLPRFFLPWGDHPPYSLVQLQLDPVGASVEYGDGLDVSITVSGGRPASVHLVLTTPDRTQTTELPTYETATNVYAHRLENVTCDMIYFARIPGSRSKCYPLKVLMIPRIDDARVELVPPVYTGLPVENHKLVDGLVRAHAGTRATLALRSNRPLRGGTMQALNRDVAMHVTDDPHTARGTFSVDRAGAFTARIEDPDGLRSRPYHGLVELIPDEKPEIAIVAPGMDSLATPEAEVTINIEARDDLGVRRIALYRNLNGSIDAQLLLFDQDEGLPFVNVVEPLALAQLGVKPGDVISYYAEAVDTRPEQPGRAITQSYNLHIISAEDYAEWMRMRTTAEELQRQYAKLQTRMSDIKQQQQQLSDELARLQQAAEQGPLEQEQQDELRRLEQKQRHLDDQTRELADDLERMSEKPPVFDIEKDYKRELVRFSKALHQAANHMRDCEQKLNQAALPRPVPGSERRAPEQNAAQAMAGAQQSMQQALQQLSKTEQRYQQGIDQANREIAQIDKLNQDLERFQQLARRQEMTTRQAGYIARKKQPDLEDAARLKDLAQEQEQIRKELTELKKDLRKHADEVRQNYPDMADNARRLARNIEKLDIEQTMKQAEQAMKAPDRKQGHAAAREAQAKLKSMCDACEGARKSGQGTCQQRLKQQLNMELGQTLRQLSRSGQSWGRGQGSSNGMGRGAGMQGAPVPGFDGPASTIKNLGMYGPQPEGEPAKESAGLNRGKSEQTLFKETQLKQAATTEERRQPAQKSELKIKLPAGDRLIEEYKQDILRYFTTLAEEEEQQP